MGVTILIISEKWTTMWFIQNWGEESIPTCSREPTKEPTKELPSKFSFPSRRTKSEESITYWNLWIIPILWNCMISCSALIWGQLVSFLNTANMWISETCTQLWLLGTSKFILNSYYKYSCYHLGFELFAFERDHA